MNPTTEPAKPVLVYGVPPQRRSSRVLHRLIGVLLMLLIVPAAFGFLASFEGGIPPLWKVGYSAFGLACLTLGAWLILKK